MKHVAMPIMLALFAAAGSTVAAEPRTSLMVTLQEEHNSGLRAVVAIRQVGPDLAITITVNPRNAAPLGARVRQGTCLKKNPRPSYRLNNVINGKSVSILEDKKLSTLDDGDYVITVRKPKSTPYTYLACGEVK
jgi:hypothetical protein